MSRETHVGEIFSVLVEEEEVPLEDVVCKEVEGHGLAAHLQ